MSLSGDDILLQLQYIIYKDIYAIDLSQTDIGLLNSLPVDKVASLLCKMFSQVEKNETEDRHIENLYIKSRIYDMILSIEEFDKVQFLIDIFEQSSIDWQIAFCRTLSEIHDVRAISKLGDVLLENTDPDVRYVAAEGLGEIGDISTINILEYAHNHDKGEDFEGFTICDIAHKSIMKIKNRNQTNHT